MPIIHDDPLWKDINTKIDNTKGMVYYSHVSDPDKWLSIDVKEWIAPLKRKGKHKKR